MGSVLACGFTFHPNTGVPQVTFQEIFGHLYVVFFAIFAWLVLKHSAFLPRTPHTQLGLKVHTQSHSARVALTCATMASGHQHSGTTTAQKGHCILVDRAHRTRMVLPAALIAPLHLACMLWRSAAGSAKCLEQGHWL
jgi:hypothetical protein